VPGGPGFVAVGLDYSAGAVSYTSADGRDWQRFDVDLPEGYRFRFMGHIGSRVLAHTDAGLFASEDGQTWTPATVPDDFGSVLAFANDGEAITAFTTAGSGERVVVFQSSDGAGWQRRGPLSDSRGVDSIVAAGGPLGWAVIGGAYRRSGATDHFAWHSTDGLDWQLAVGAPSNVTDLYADDAGYVAVGHFYPGGGCAIAEDEAWGTTWTSVDGTIWRQMPEAGWHHREIDLLRRLGRTLIGIGIDWTRDGANGSIWTVDLPSRAVAGPAPDPTPTPAPQGCGGP
jgi:hypothetical protein